MCLFFRRDCYSTVHQYADEYAFTPSALISLTPNEQEKTPLRAPTIKQFFINIKRDEKISSPFCTRPCPARYSALYLFIFRVVISEVFTNVKVKLLRSEVCTNVQVKLSLPTLPKAKLHYPQDNFTYGVNFTCP